MFKNYLKIAFRNFARNKVFSFINIFGLSVGLVTCLLILLYIFDESSFDKHHKDGERIFRIASVSSNNESWAAAAAPVAWDVKSDLPEVEQVTRLLTFPDIEKMVLKYEDHSDRKEFLEPNGYYVDSTFFQIFTYDFTYGNTATALNQPNSMVISDELAHKFFGNNNPIGKLIMVNTPMGGFTYTVYGVFNKSRYKSHIPANFFLSMRNNDMGKWVEGQTSWAFNNVFFTYVKLKEHTNSEVFLQKLKRLFELRASKDLKAAGISKSLFIQPMQDIYLHSALGNEIAANGNITYLYILGSIAVFILLIACINFMNLSTARSEKRGKEVGVRKVMGAGKRSLIRQFLGESIVMSLAALVIALIIVSILLPVFNRLTQKHMQMMDNPRLLLCVMVLTLSTGLLAGFYPAFYLSAFMPVSVLKGKMKNSLSSSVIRKGLVVFQFTISICLILAAIVIWQQLDLFKNQQLGFNKTRQIILPLQVGFNNSESNYTLLRDEILKNPQIKTVTCGSTYPGIPNVNDLLFYGEGKTVNDVVDVELSAIDGGYFETLGIKLLSGRTFSGNSRADSTGIILNESAVKKLGYTIDNAIGKKIQSDLANNHFSMQIIGVVRDYNFESLHSPIKPLGFTHALFVNKYSYMIANFSATDYTGLLANLEVSWKKVIPQSPFIYSFLDQDFQRNYEKEQLTSRIVIYFTVIAILIACLGLLGLAIFSAEQRTKEIGIRKVLGASVSSVTALLSKEFIRLVIIAIIIASPLSWYMMNKWLENFAYRIHLSWWMFCTAGALAIFITMITVIFQSVKAALTNPIKSLKME
ncbi:putative ABC transport system permease protein [Chitinophaga niastensis]|uniref:Putative ABC transport system permease protein n=1 Tax=Chitinophaga niastensis TaxID=536980 RepID=A0A2P8HCH9_CHINA|nr:ABC transporter permease [Chitinophaga niastensis]PSL43937.1 putative ABC transport system permease protein [Chitinophaga niastensis]